MRQRLERTGFWLALLLALTILGLGAREAWASASRTCMDDGWTFLGWKPSQEVCLAACVLLHGNEAQERYGPEGCCSCLF